jgi:hypothetical protein
MTEQPQPQPDPIEALAQQADAVLNAAYLRMNTVEPQLRRFARAAADLGLPVPADWATQPHDAADAAVVFAPLTPRRFDALIRLLEDIAANRPVVITRGQAGASLFDAGPAVGPAPAPAPSSVHMAVPR